MLGGVGGVTMLKATWIKQCCNVTGYAAPQNRFELRLPLSPDWNQNFLFQPAGASVAA
jgi:hypothetical protein